MKVTVIVPTLANQARAMQIKRCVASIRLSSKHPISIIVVVNGDRFDPETCEWLQHQCDVRFEKILTASAPLAVLRGRELVETPYFSTLDDDDEYLQGSTDLKLSELETQDRADLVVTNCFRSSAGVDTVLYDDLSDVRSDPLKSLFRIPWLNSGNALYRTDSIATHYFSNPHPFAEWTWLAYQLAVDGKRVLALDAPSTRINVTPGSLSSSNAYRAAYQDLFERMLTLAPSPKIRRLILQRMSADWHDRSDRALKRGNKLDAMLSHLRSLLLPRGLRYLPYTRHLLKRKR